MIMRLPSNGMPSAALHARVVHYLLVLHRVLPSMAR
jgi:hypothetical protein